MSWPPRVPGTQSPHWRREVACGTDPTLALVRALRALRALRDLPIHTRQVWNIAVSHDDGCPATENGPMAACTCEIVWLEAKKAA